MLENASGGVKPHKATPGEVVTTVKSSLSRAYGVYGACPFRVVVLTTLSAYSQECVNSVLAKKPESAHELVKAITEFEATHGNATKVEKVDYGGRRGFSSPRQYCYGAKKVFILFLVVLSCSVKFYSVFV